MSKLALNRMISALRELRNAPFEELPRLTREFETLGNVTVNGTDVPLASMAADAKRLVRQIPRLHASALPAMRCALLMLSDVLEMQAIASDCVYSPAVARIESAASDQPRPYYLERD